MRWCCLWLKSEIWWCNWTIFIVIWFKEMCFPTHSSYKLFDFINHSFVSIKTTTKMRHNKPDLIIWNYDTKVCTIVEFSSPLDINTAKMSVNTWSVSTASQEFTSIVQHPGYIPKCFVTYLKMIGFKGKEIKLLIHIM